MKVFRHYISVLVLLLAFVANLDAQVQQVQVARTSQHDIYNQRGVLEVRIVYSYDMNGNVALRTLYSFDKHGRITRRMQYSDTDYLMLDDNFEYDKHGNLVYRKTKFYDEWEGKSSFKEKRKYKYDNEGNITYRAYYMDGDLYFEDPPRVVAADTAATAAQPTPAAPAADNVAPSAQPDENQSAPAKKQKNQRSKKKKQ